VARASRGAMRQGAGSLLGRDVGDGIAREGIGNPKTWNPDNPFCHSPGRSPFWDLWVGSERLPDVTPGILDANAALLADAWTRATVGIPGFE